MKKIILLGLLLLYFAGEGRANQNPLYSQFMTNPYLINPALAGTYPYYQIMTNNRLQWVGMTDAPMTNVISMYGPMVSQPMGLGGYIMSDITYPTSTTSLNVSYAYNYGIAEDLKVSMGLTLGIMQYKMQDLRTEVEDPIIREGEVYKQVAPDATLGVYLYSSTYNVGIAVTQLFGNKLKFGTDTITGLSRLKQHFYLHGGYKYFINREMALEPTLIFRKVAATPLQMDINVRFWYGKRQWKNNEKVWGGLAYRTQDAITVLVGFTYQKKIEIGYSYDISLNKLSGYHSGSHELMLGFKFNNIKDY